MDNNLEYCICCNMLKQCLKEIDASNKQHLRRISVKTQIHLQHGNIKIV